MKKGKLIIIEGTDGTGKGTQFAKLIERIKRSGKKVATFDFPQYGKPSAFFVEQYLNGKYGTAKQVGPYKASLFYAMDRFDIAPKVAEALREGKMVVSNRYVESNMGHQGAKIADRAKRMRFFRWVKDTEYGLLDIPKPDLCIILHIPAEIAQQLVDKKASRKYIHGRKRDIHEADLGHLKLAERVYLEIARLFPKTHVVIECVEKGRLLSIDEVHEKIWRAVKNRI
ncbi:MAG: thymidylate kinase [Patescibacteria group bacterium]|nr:thymidylate kinase [Patescibacteria group bacterium]